MRFSRSTLLNSRFCGLVSRPYTTAGTRPVERNFFTPPRRVAVRGNAVKGTDFIFDSASGRLTGAPALKFKKRSHRRITVDSFDGFTQQTRDRQRGYFHAVNSGAEDGISSYQFVNSRFPQPFDAEIVEDRVRNAGEDLLRAIRVHE